MGSVPVESELDALSNSVPDLIASGDIQGAEKACRELLERHPGQVDGLKRFAEVYQAKGDAAKAAEYLRKSAGFMLASPEGRSPEAIQLLLDEANIREVIMFPLNQQAQDPLLGAPSLIEDARYKELHLSYKAPKTVKSD